MLSFPTTATTVYAPPAVSTRRRKGGTFATTACRWSSQRDQATCSRPRHAAQAARSATSSASAVGGGARTMPRTRARVRPPAVPVRMGVTMPDFFCFTCGRHKPDTQRAPDATSRRAICKSCDGVRARRAAKPGKPSSATQIRAGHRVIFNHLRNIGEL